MLHLHLLLSFFFLRKRVVFQGVFGIEDVIWAVLSSFRVNFYKVYSTIYCCPVHCPVVLFLQFLLAL